MADPNRRALSITPTGGTPIFIFLNVNEVHRFKREHDAWMKSGQLHGQFAYNEEGIAKYIRFDNIFAWSDEPIEDHETKVY